MKHNIKYIMKKFLYQERATSSSYIQYLRKKGFRLAKIVLFIHHVIALLIHSIHG